MLCSLEWGGGCRERLERVLIFRPSSPTIVLKLSNSSFSTGACGEGRGEMNGIGTHATATTAAGTLRRHTRSQLPQDVPRGDRGSYSRPVRPPPRNMMNPRSRPPPEQMEGLSSALFPKARPQEMDERG